MLPSIFLVGGCDKSVDSGISTRDLQTPSIASEEMVSGAASDSDAIKSVPLVPLSPSKQEPVALAEPPKTLGIGDANPGLKIAKWVKGDPVDEPLEGKVHVVEFWATWCGPCRVGMPHISQLQSEYGDEVTFIGVTREDEAKVTSFLESDSPSGKTWDAVIQYRLALDNQDWTNTAYMRAASQNGIPCAFVVGRDGVVEWIGHPASIDEPLKQIVEGKWDREAAVVAFQKEQRLKTVLSKLTPFVRAKDWDGAVAIVEEMEDELGTSLQLMQTKLNIFETAGRIEDASALRAKVVEAAWDNAAMLNQIAWETATRPNSPDLDLALKAAQRASELQGNKDAAMLDTLARCYYELGQLDEAIKWQRLAVENNQGQKEIDAVLEQYLKEKSESEPKSEPKSEPTEASAANESDTDK